MLSTLDSRQSHQSPFEAELRQEYSLLVLRRLVA